MGRILSENIHAKRKRVIVELLKGKRMATQLQTLLQKPAADHGLAVSVDDLARQVLRSFTVTLSVLNSCDASTGSEQIAAVDGVGSACSGDGEKKPVVKDRRGCYKRRRTCESRMTVFPVVEDGYAWRKYGQKAILNSEYPRCYFRCTYKQQGCKAIKQVQRLKNDPILYQTTYFNHHTCTQAPNNHNPAASSLLTGSDPAEPANILSFQTNNIQLKQAADHRDHDHMMIMNIKKEDDDNNINDVVSDAKSSVLDDPWEDIIGSGESFGYRPIWEEGGSSGLYSCGSTTLRGLDMEVNQLGDIDSFHFDEIDVLLI